MTQWCSPSLPLAQDLGMKGKMGSGPAAKAVTEGGRVLSMSGPEVRMMTEIEMSVNPSDL